jgi:hypothetical protein
MALKTNYELDNVIYSDAYLRIHKIRTVAVDYEYFENVDDPERPDIAQELKWKIRLESSATAYVWNGKESRDNRAQPLKWFSFEFEYDLDSPKNIYAQAYDALKTAKEFSDAVDV